MRRFNRRLFPAIAKNFQPVSPVRLDYRTVNRNGR